MPYFWKAGTKQAGQLFHAFDTLDIDEALAAGAIELRDEAPAVGPGGEHNHSRPTPPPTPAPTPEPTPDPEETEEQEGMGEDTAAMSKRPPRRRKAAG